MCRGLAIALVAALRMGRTEAAPDVPPAATASVHGTVRHAGTLPVRLKQLTNTVDVATCGATVTGEGFLRGRAGELANVFVEVRGPDGALLPGAALAPGAAPVTLRLQRCVLVPHVQVLAAGSTVAIENDDRTFHDLATLAVRNEAASALLPRYRRRVVLPADHFRRPEKIKVTCARHAWATAWLVVTDNRYSALTGADGRFTIDGLPPGPHVVTAWHEELGVTGQDIVSSAGPTTVDLVFR